MNAPDIKRRASDIFDLKLFMIIINEI